MIDFLLNGQIVTETDISPTMTVLRYLRTKKVLTGTKEGCASGDCGACTVLVGAIDQGKASYMAVNSCITMLGDMHGKHIVTVEGVGATKDNQNTDHPVQVSMVEHHGSQCGFCTPGIVMSLVGLRERQTTCDRQEVLEALSGNLCRCTGYRSICAAAKAAFDQPLNQNALNSTASWEVSQSACPSLSNPAGQYFAPETESELRALLTEYPAARFVAGGTDLALEVTQQYESPSCLISLSNVNELSHYGAAADYLSIGGNTTYSQLVPWLEEYYPEVTALISRIGSLQIRNRGTVGGNVANASPIGDMPPILLALNASLELATANGTRVVPIVDFFTGYKKTILQSGEYIRRIFLPKPQNNTYLKLYKISKRYEDDISAVMAAFYIELEDGVIKQARLAYGGMAATPAFAQQTQAQMTGQLFTAKTIEAALLKIPDDFTPMTDVRATDRYRITIAQNLLRKAFVEIDQATALGVYAHA